MIDLVIYHRTKHRFGFGAMRVDGTTSEGLGVDPAADRGFWTLFDAAPDGVLVVAEAGDIVFANAHASDLFGATQAELEGCCVDALVPDSVVGRHRAHRTRYNARPQARAMGAGSTLRGRRRDGTEFFAEVSLSPFVDGDRRFTVVAVRDTSDRLAEEDRLHRILATLDASDDGIFMFDAETLQFAHVNEGAVRLVGYDRSSLAEMTPMHLNPHTSEPEYRALVGELLARPGQHHHRTTALMRADGTEVPVEKTYWAASPARDGTRWIVALARDISERLAADAALQASDAALRAAHEQLLLAEDRDRIARDLHDTVIQRLFAAGLVLQSLASGTDERTSARLQYTVDELDETIRDLRMAVFSLTAQQAPPGLRGRLLDVITDATPALRSDPRLEFNGAIDALPERIAEHLVATLRDALSNLVHRAQGCTIWVTVSVGDDVHLRVDDDGTGASDDLIGAHGAATLARRAEHLGGSCLCGPRRGGGNRLDWRVPLGVG